LGLSLQPDLSPELVRQFKLPDMNGALVTTVEPDSPAAKAGFQEGDFIVEFDGKKVTDMRQLRLMVSQTAPGTKVKSKLVREGSEKTLTATLGTMPEEALARTRRTPQGERGQSKMDALDGIEVTDIDSRTRRQLEIPNNVRGALVGNVEQDSNAAEAGLRPGDVILEIDRQPVRDAESAVTLSEKTKSDRLLLRIWRAGDGRGGMFYLTVDNTKRK